MQLELKDRDDPLTESIARLRHNAHRYEPEQIEMFDDVLGRMISHIEGRALAELSRRLAPVNNAPLRQPPQVMNAPIIQPGPRANQIS